MPRTRKEVKRSLELENTPPAPHNSEKSTGAPNQRVCNSQLARGSVLDQRGNGVLTQEPMSEHRARVHH